MTLEAVKALFGQLPPYNPSVMTGATAQSPQEELVSNRMRIRAWSMVASQVPFPISFSFMQPFFSASAQSPLLFILLSSFFPYAPLSSSSAGVKKDERVRNDKGFRAQTLSFVTCRTHSAREGQEREGVGGGGGVAQDHAQ